MDGFANGAEMISCPHCGADMRRGMIRCRECGQSTKETEGDFELTGHVLLENQDPKCPRCGSILEPGAVDCAVCTSQMLDQLMKGPPTAVPAPGPHVAPPRQTSAAEPNLRRAARDEFIEFNTTSESSLRPRPTGATTAKGATAAPPATHPTRNPAAPSNPAPPNQAPAARTSKPPAAPPAKPADPSPPTPVAADPEEEDAPAASVETSPACAALLASLAGADANLRCEIATALGKLGDKAALAPLERHMGDKDIRVRRAVAAALVQLGHEKGETLLAIAERMPASSVLMLAKPPAKIRKSSGGGTSIDQQTLIKVGGGLLAAAVVGGGIWMWMNSSPAPRRGAKKAKAAATANKAPAAAPKPKAGNIGD